MTIKSTSIIVQFGNSPTQAISHYLAKNAHSRPFFSEKFLFSLVVCEMLR